MVKGLFDLTGRIALVTGAGQGIGEAIATGLVEAGAHVVLNGRDAKKLARVADALSRTGAKTSIAAFDVTDRVLVSREISRIEKEIGPIDILVNNAGTNLRGPAADYSWENWDTVIDINLNGVFALCRDVGRHMLTRKRGKIINICSVMSEVGRATIPAYNASKGAVKLLTKSLCAEWGKHNIQVNGIGPGYVVTDLNKPLLADKAFTTWVETRTPAARWAQPHELAGAAVFLASDASSYVNGHILMVDGGMTAVI